MTRLITGTTLAAIMTLSAGSPPLPPFVTATKT